MLLEKQLYLIDFSKSQTLTNMLQSISIEKLVKTDLSLHHLDSAIWKHFLIPVFYAEWMINAALWHFAQTADFRCLVSEVTIVRKIRRI